MGMKPYYRQPCKYGHAVECPGQVTLVRATIAMDSPRWWECDRCDWVLWEGGGKPRPPTEVELQLVASYRRLLDMQFEYDEDWPGHHADDPDWDGGE